MYFGFIWVLRTLEFKWREGKLSGHFWMLSCCYRWGRSEGCSRWYWGLSYCAGFKSWSHKTATLKRYVQNTSLCEKLMALVFHILNNVNGKLKCRDGKMWTSQDCDHTFGMCLASCSRGTMAVNECFMNKMRNTVIENENRDQRENTGCWKKWETEIKRG